MDTTTLGISITVFFSYTVLEMKIYWSESGADPGFQVRGGALKKIAPSGGKIIFFPILGGRAPGAPPGSAPVNQILEVI